ncbi:MAG TPA: glutamate--tRNA ligase [Candidatus Absconditabacterales bacterium]|nr:glutamate--tRNA ligase [Candidatus Absconditabacterales bacterium]HMT26685.1 glutamate--tRNA ligase [Candidatus Absconditabacterales bacterium]
MSKQIAEFLFPEIKKNIEDYQKTYPARPAGQIVTRFAPSPTGVLHIGGVYSALVGERFAHQQNGKFFLRIEDTDQKRFVEGAIDKIVNGLKIFGIEFNEGPIGPDFKEIGEYGPYTQSHRKEIYQTFAKKLIEEGKAYPCFLTAEEIEEIKKIQTISKKMPGVYGTYAKYREISLEEIQKNSTENKPFVIRLKNQNDPSAKVTLHDLVKGDLVMQDNFVDVVLLKSDGIPTYHFAHLVDDHLMGTTHVIRGEEWLPSLPLHQQLFKLFNFKSPQYAHTSTILKLDNGNKRKLSKRKDPEADIFYFIENGYSIAGLKEYLINIANSSFEDRRAQNPEKKVEEFQVVLEKINKSGALLDMQKIDFLSQQALSTLSTPELFEQGKTRASQFDKELFELMKKYPDYTISALNIERGGEKDPKRIHIFSDLRKNLAFFYDELFEQTEEPTLPEIDSETIKNFLNTYIKNLNLTQTKEERFEQLKSIGQNLGFALTNQDFKTGNFKGKIGDLAMILRILLCHSSQTPDLFETMQVMGTERVIKRLSI